MITSLILFDDNQNDDDTAQAEKTSYSKIKKKN